MFNIDLSALIQNLDFWAVLFRCVIAVFAAILLALAVVSALRKRCPECSGTMKPKANWDGNQLYECQSCGEEGWTLR